MFSPARRLWILPDCPQDLIDTAPPGYGPGCVALVFGSTVGDLPPVAWTESLCETSGFSEVICPTFALRRDPAFCWVLYYDPTGQAEPAGLLPPPPPEPEPLPEDP